MADASANGARRDDLELKINERLLTLNTEQLTEVAKYLNLGEDLHVNKNKKSLIRSIRKSIDGINDGEDTTGEPGDDVAAADLGREELLSNILNMVETMHLEEQQANILAKNGDLNKTEKKNSSSPEEEGITKPSETGVTIGSLV